MVSGRDCEKCLCLLCQSHGQFSGPIPLPTAEPVRRPQELHGRLKVGGGNSLHAARQ